jgi:hypothetical protein
MSIGNLRVLPEVTCSYEHAKAGPMRTGSCCRMTGDMGRLCEQPFVLISFLFMPEARLSSCPWSGYQSGLRAPMPHSHFYHKV